MKLCRHKGVIEAAGISLSNIVKILTENNSCEKWLESIISEVIHLIEHKTGATVSRKSAGLSILVQNIVGNDRRTNKVFRKKKRFFKDFYFYNLVVKNFFPLGKI